MNRFTLIVLFILIQVIGYKGEKIPVNAGTGWDGKHYAYLTIHFKELAEQKQIDSYQYQRILTPAIIYYLCLFFNVTLNNNTIVSIFSLYNAVLLLASCLVFFSMSTYLQLKKNLETIGFASLFLNYFTLKNTPYYPILTDCTAFFAGLCLAYFFIKNKSVAVGFITTIGHFCYPLFLFISLPLYLNLRKQISYTFFNSVSVIKVIATATILSVLFGFGLIIFKPTILLQKYTLALNTFLLPLSIILIVLYIWRAMLAFNNRDVRIGNIEWTVPTIKLISVFLFIAAVQYLVKQYSIPEEIFTPAVFILNLLQQAIDNPLVSLVSHIIYLGPALLLVILFYPYFVKTITSYGSSAVAYFYIAIILSIGSETRQFIHVYPFIIFMLLITLNKFDIAKKQAAFFTIISLALSKFWFTINRPELFSKYDYEHFPDQRYFMNHGPFMSNTSYLINLSVTICVGIFIYILFRGVSKSHTNLATSDVSSL